MSVTILRRGMKLLVYQQVLGGRMLRPNQAIALTALAVMIAGPASAAGNAANGLKYLSQLNLTVFGTLTTNGQEVEGKTFAGALNMSNPTNFGIGSSTQSAAASDFDVLDVVNNATGLIRLKAGSPNGSNGVVGTVARIGGNMGSGDFNDAAGYSGSFVVGGNVTGSGGPFNINAHSVTYGGTVASGINGAVHDATLAAGGANDVHADLAAKLVTLQDDLTALSDTLFAMPSLGTITGTTTALNYTGATGGYAVFTMTAAAFDDSNSNFDNLFSNVPAGYTTIINVLGTSLTEQGNVNSKALNQSVIWNFNQATSVSLKGFHGSVLAPFAAVTNSSALEGSIVAKSFTLNGEVHLGTFDGPNFLEQTSGVPEPASWAMLVGGFGLIGSAMRSRRNRISSSFG
jgi:choice-of-anchor A domain-containing protein